MSLEKLSKQVLYIDNDSLINIGKENQYNPKKGIYLEDIIDDEDFITEYVSAGFKNYAIIT